MSVLLSVSVALLAGLLMTRVLKPLKMPDVTADLIAGVLVSLCAALLVVSPMNEVHSFLNRDAVAASYVRREPLDALAEDIRDNCAEDERVYFVSQGSDGRDQVIVRFGAEPILVDSVLGHSLNPEATSAEAWRSVLLEGYDYVALCQLDDEFAASYGCLFEHPEEITDHALYRLDRQKGLLSRVQG